MPVYFDREPVRSGLPADGLPGAAPGAFDEADASCLTIGLINNMPDPALQATERQFVALLGAAADGLGVRLRPYALPEVPRTEWGREYVTRCYAGLDALWSSQLDGLIVTGTEPRSPNLRDEPYWGSLISVLEWAEQHTYSAVWSCLATHAALLHLDGADAFVKERKSLFVFFQGHPEYEAHTLLLEYRRDIKRFLTRERETYPTMPRGYFDEATVAVLTALRERALADRREEILADFPTALAAATVTNTWRPTATHLYRNWLLYMSAEKARALERGRTRRSVGE